MIKTVLAEFIGLFVDDVPFAVTIAVWLLVASLVLPRLGVPAPALVLALGLAGILVESAVRRARR